MLLYLNPGACRLFEVVDYSEIPGTGRARPCFLMVEGKDGEMHEADTGIARGQFLATMFEQGGKKYCCIIGCPVTILFILCCFMMLSDPSLGGILALIVLFFLLWFCIWCICGNWCGRAANYRNSPQIYFEPLTGDAPVPTTNTTTANQLQQSGKQPTADLRQTYDQPMQSERESAPDVTIQS